MSTRISWSSGGEGPEFLWAKKIGKAIWFHYQGVTYEYKKSVATMGAADGFDESDKVISPMPGRILLVNVKKGDKVKTGDILVSMEAMKMEYTLKAPFDGVVRNVNCKIDDQVEVDFEMVVLERSSE